MIYSNPLLKLSCFSCLVKKSGDKRVDFFNRVKGVDIYYTGFARAALLKGLEVLKIKKGDNVLVPAYICKAAIEPFNVREVEVRYYKINKDFSANFGDLEKKIDKNSKALLYVNYFGLTNNAKDYQVFCRDKKLCLIEDSAHALYGDYDAIKGDIAIFSLRKFFPVANGALLIVKNNKLDTGKIFYEYVEVNLGSADYKFIIASLCRKIYHYFYLPGVRKILLAVKKRRERLLPQNVICQDDLLYKNVLKSSFAIINNSNSYDIIVRRRDNYNFLWERLMPLSDKYLKLPFRMINNEGCPMAFPLIVIQDRESFMENLFLRGYVSYPWPDMPKEVRETGVYKEELFLSKTVVLLPIHQGLTRKYLEIMAGVIKEWVGKIDTNN